MANLTIKHRMSVWNVFDLTISSVSKLTDNWSSEVLIDEIPWSINVCKDDEEKSLGVYIQCKKADSLDWALPAQFMVYLFSFKENKYTLCEGHGPHVFRSTDNNIGTSALIQWNDLFNDERRYVKDDMIKIMIYIMVENRNISNPAILTFETVNSCGSLGIFELTVKNIANLLAVSSPTFNLRDLPWEFRVYRNGYDLLGISLDTEASFREISFDVTMSVNLVSSKNDVDSIKRQNTNDIQFSKSIDIDDIILWDELMKPENGFVNNNSITLAVEVKIIKQKCSEPKRSKGVKRLHSSV